MRRYRSLVRVLALGGAVGMIAGCTAPGLRNQGDPGLSTPNEKRIANLRQLTFGGTNAEAYWSFDGDALTFQHSGDGVPCDQIYTMNVDGKDRHRVSNGEGRTTCSFYYPDDGRVLFSSTSAAAKACPPPPDMSKGYVWAIYDSFQFYSATPDGKDVRPIEPGAPKAYNAEMVSCKDGKVVFTSDRNGDLDLYVGHFDKDGFIKDVKQVTNTLGYDGGAFFSPDCTKLVWRASRPRPGKEQEEYVSLLRKHLVKPTKLEIWTADADGKNARQVTRLGAASFAPYFTPDKQKILFSSNVNDPAGGRKFDLFLIRTNGTELEQVTYSKGFDSFPMFSPDGRYLAFSSTRNARKPHENNIFIADWNAKAPGPLVTEEDSDPANRYFSVVRELASPDFEGRGVGTDGLKRAEGYVEELFQKAGIHEMSEAFDFGGKVQAYDHAVEIQVGVDADWANSLVKADWKQLKPKDEFAPASFSSADEIKGTLLDAGYGIVAPEMKIDDYASKNPKGKVVLIRRRVPRGLSLSPALEAQYGDLKYKAFLARERGAQAVVFWDPETEDESEKTKEKLTFSLDESDRYFTSDSGLPVIFVSKRVAREWLSAAKPPKITGQVSLLKKNQTANNLVGWVGDKDACKKDRPIVIGAHLDHLGLASENSLESSKKGVHHGADDNASGVAALLEVARFLNQSKAKGCYILAAFTGEEIGVVGSSHLVKLFEEYKVKPKAMLNMDMVGRMTNNSLFVFGGDTAREWKKIVKAECDERTLSCATGGDGYGPSDHMPFYLSKVPVLHFFTGAHADYHRVSDTPEKINATGGVQVAEVVAAIAKAAQKKTVTYVPAPRGKDTMGAIRGRSDRSHTSGGAYLGTIPDYSQMANSNEPITMSFKNGTTLVIRGVKLSGVRNGSPADQAGLREGDIITSITVLEDDPGYPATHPKQFGVQNLQDYTFVIQNLKPGIKIRISAQRSDRKLELDATVGRKEQGENHQ